MSEQPDYRPRLKQAGRKLELAKSRARALMADVYGLIRLAILINGVTEMEAARLAGVDRMTVRRAVGKQK